MYSIVQYRLSLDKKAESLNSENFFTNNSEEALFKHRHAIERGQEHFYCACCEEELKISGGGETKQRLHFRHKKQDIDRECVYSDDQHPTRREIEVGKYGNKEESLLHQSIKNTFASVLENSGYDVYVERWIKNEKEPKHPRRPDIRAISIERDIDMAVEIQLTTTFLDTIIGRNEFYRSRHMFIFWVFYNVKNNFTQKDITYDSYYQNIFVFDEEVQQLTRTENQLYLKCFYNKYYCDPTNGIIKKKHNFTCKIVAFEDLHFDRENCEIYYYNPYEAQEQLKIEQKTIREELEEQRRMAMLEEIRREDEEKKRAEEEERQRKKEEEQRILEAQLAEEQRKRDIENAQKEQISNYIYYDKITVEEFWQYYQQLNDEEKSYMDEAIYDIIIKGVARRYAYAYNRQYQNDNNINKLFKFLYKQGYPFRWERFVSVPEMYFHHTPKDLNVLLLKNITILLYLKNGFRLPNGTAHLEQIKKELYEIIRESQGYPTNQISRVNSLNDMSLIFICFERLLSSTLDNNDNLIWVYNNIDVIRHLYSIYLGQIVGEERNSDYYAFYVKLADPYYLFYKRMIECRKNIFTRSGGLLQNLAISEYDIENKLNELQIKPHYTKADIERMSVLFPEIPWDVE